MVTLNDRIVLITGILVMLIGAVGITLKDTPYITSPVFYIVITAIVLVWILIIIRCVISKELEIPITKQEEIDRDLKALKGKSIKQKLFISMDLSREYHYPSDVTYYVKRKCWESMKESINPDVLMVDEL